MRLLNAARAKTPERVLIPAGNGFVPQRGSQPAPFPAAGHARQRALPARQCGLQSQGACAGALHCTAGCGLVPAGNGLVPEPQVNAHANLSWRYAM
jgi:hypothetical protein